MVVPGLISDQSIMRRRVTRESLVKSSETARESRHPAKCAVYEQLTEFTEKSVGELLETAFVIDSGFKITSPNLYYLRFFVECYLTCRAIGWIVTEVHANINTFELNKRLQAATPQSRKATNSTHPT